MKGGHSEHMTHQRKPRKSLIRRTARRVAHTISSGITNSLDPDNANNYGGKRRRTHRGRKTLRGRKTHRGRKTFRGRKTYRH